MQEECVQGNAALEVFSRCKVSITYMLLKLQKQLNFYTDLEDLLSETQERWVTCFDVYEDDKQYLRYMFVVMKNKIRDVRKDKYRYNRVHVSDPRVISKRHASEGEMGENYVRVWNEMAVDTKEERPDVTAELNELVDKIMNSLSRDFHKQVFQKMIEGLPHKRISEELGCSTGHVIKTKTEHIWPVVRQIMEIPDEKYAVLIDSGRIYCP